MVRALISLTDKSLKRIDTIARKEKKSRAQVIREYVEEGLKRNDKELSWKEIVQQTAGLWKDKKVDGVEYQRKLRAEWGR